MSISMPGISSGLDVNGLVTQLMQVEQRPLDLLRSRESGFQVKLSAFGKVTGALAQLQGALAALASRSALDAVALTSSDATVLTAAATGTAAAGSYALEVQQLAQAQSLASAAFAAATDVVGGGTLTIEYGSVSGTTFTPNASRAAQAVTIAAGSSLAATRDAINAAGIGVAASIVNDGSGYRLLLAAKDSGAANALRITVADGDGNNMDTSGLSQLAWDPAAAAGAGRNLTQTMAARDALVSVNGLALSRASNTMTDVIDGVSLQLRGTGSATLGAGPDAAAVQKQLQGFVTAYNQLNAVLANLTAYDPAAKTGGALLGDSAVRSLQAKLRGLLGANVAGLGGSLTALSHLGIAFQKDGSLAVDGAKLANLLAADFAAVADVVAGVAAPLDTLIRGMLDAQGAIGGRVAGMQDSIKRLGIQEEAVQARLAAIEKRYRAQFTALDVNLARMNATGTALQGQLDALAKLRN